MAMPEFSMRQLLEAGVHFGHNTRRWNPKMEQYIFGVRNKVHILDLQQTVPMLHAALAAVREVTARGGRVLFVGTKRQASEIVAEAAGRCGQYYVNHRWLAVAEASTLNIPVVAVIDSNSSPKGVTFPIPGNDDAIRSITLYCDLLSAAVLDGLQQEAISSGEDLGAAEEAPVEELPAEAAPAEAVPAEAAAPAAEAAAPAEAPAEAAAPAGEKPAAE